MDAAANTMNLAGSSTGTFESHQDNQTGRLRTGFGLSATMNAGGVNMSDVVGGMEANKVGNYLIG